MSPMRLLPAESCDLLGSVVHKSRARGGPRSVNPER